jgi:hypothetical protein
MFLEGLLLGKVPPKQKKYEILTLYPRYDGMV